MAKRNLSGSSSGRRGSSRNSSDRSNSSRTPRKSGGNSRRESSSGDDKKGFGRKGSFSSRDNKSFGKSSGGFKKRDDQSGDERRYSRGRNSSSDKPFKRGRRDSDEGNEKRSFGRRDDSFSSRSKKPYRSKEDNRDERRDFRSRRSDSDSGERSSYRSKRTNEEGSSRGFNKDRKGSDFKSREEQRGFRSRRSDSDSGERSSYRSRRTNDEGSSRGFNKDRKGSDFKSRDEHCNTRGTGSFRDRNRNDRSESGNTDRRSSRKRFDREEQSEKRSFKRPANDQEEQSGFFNKERGSKRPRSKKIEETSFDEAPVQTEKMRLNRFIANSGVCSRREADELISMGLISVNGKTVTELGYKVNPGDEVRYESKLLKAEKPVYILMNKPKGFLTTTDDPQERNTVMHIIGSAVKERIYPVGRLDRNTTGLLLLTNDGDLADKLMHPSYNVKKIYKVELDRPITKADLQKVSEGVMLEEGRAVVDDLAVVSPDGKTVGVELHIGWNRVVRRIFESMEYEVIKLDRTVYAGLDKKDLARGQWRFLKKEEIVRLKHYK